MAVASGRLPTRRRPAEPTTRASEVMTLTSRPVHLASLAPAAPVQLRGAAGVVGTVEVRVRDQHRPAVHTTPEAPDLQRLLAEMADAGVQAAAMEVSSHGLALRRVDGTRFKAAIFTNLTQDHLDFHADL